MDEKNKHKNRKAIWVEYILERHSELVSGSLINSIISNTVRNPPIYYRDFSFVEMTKYMYDSLNNRHLEVVTQKLNIMNKKSPFSRRQFVKTTSVAAIGAPLILKSSLINAKGITSASDKVNLGIIGCGGLGTANLSAASAHPDIVVTAACDVWKERLDPITEKYNCTGYTDFRELLQHKGLDAVIIATPAHWHAIQAIEAAKAGLDIYLQKPMTMHLGESLAVAPYILYYIIV